MKEIVDTAKVTELEENADVGPENETHRAKDTMSCGQEVKRKVMLRKLLFR